LAASIEEIVSLALFARVVEQRSFTHAARALGLSKSVVSARVARLEERLGLRLLHRTTRRVTPTEEGLALYDRAARLVAAADEEVGETASGAPRGLVRVSAPARLAELYLAAPIAEFLAKNDAARVELVTSDRLVDLVKEGFDLAIRISTLRDSSLVARRLATDRLVVAAAPSYLARSGTRRVPEDLSQHECLRSAHIPANGEWGFRGVSSGARVSGGGRFVASDAGVLKEAAAAGLGLAVLPSCLIAPELASGRLVVVLEGFPRRELGIHAVHPHRRLVPPKVRVDRLPRCALRAAAVAEESGASRPGALTLGVDRKPRTDSRSGRRARLHLPPRGPNLNRDAVLKSAALT
jgi:DNA-binding transcriptional LysR family regulator